MCKGVSCSNGPLCVSDIRRWQGYVEPGDEMESGSPTKRISRNLELDSGEDLLPLPENTLTRNLGLDLIVVVTKVRKSDSVQGGKGKMSGRPFPCSGAIFFELKHIFGVYYLKGKKY